MKIAVPYENGEVFPHFGHAAEFKIYMAEDFKPIESEIVKIEDASHEAAAGYLKKRGVDLLICDGIGDGAREAVEAAHILLCSNVSGKADEVVEQFLDGSLDFTTGSSCEHHDGGSACADGDIGTIVHGYIVGYVAATAKTASRMRRHAPLRRSST